MIIPRELQDVDGMITDVPARPCDLLCGLCAAVFVDRTHRAIGLSHSGWRGTVKAMGQETIKAMKEAFGTRPEDLVVCIGPSICADCYEVGPEVAEEFAQAFSQTCHSAILEKKPDGKYQLDLWRANQIVLEEAA